MYRYADIDKYRFFSNGSTNQEISGTKPHPRPASNIFFYDKGGKSHQKIESYMWPLYINKPGLLDYLGLDIV